MKVLHFSIDFSELSLIEYLMRKPCAAAHDVIVGYIVHVGTTSAGKEIQFVITLITFSCNFATDNLTYFLLVYHRCGTPLRDSTSEQWPVCLHIPTSIDYVFLGNYNGCLNVV